MALKDTKLEEREELVVKGTILADEFRDRQTGKKIDPLGDKVSIDEIDSGNATSGKVITANGSGGASWNNIPDPTSAQVLSALENQDLKVKTIEQSEANFKLDDTKFSITAPTGIEVTKKYCAIEVINNIFYIILNYEFYNPTESSISIGNLSYITINDIPEDIGSKIFTSQGHNLTEITANEEGITGGRMASDNANPNAGFYSTHNIAVNKPAGNGNQNKIYLKPRDVSNVGSGARCNYTFRTFLTLL